MIEINRIEFLEDETIVTFNIGDIKDCRLSIGVADFYDIEYIVRYIKGHIFGLTRQYNVLRMAYTG